MVLVRGRDSVDRIPSDGQPRSRSGLGSVAGGRLLPHRAYEARWRRLADARRIRPSRPACACILTNDADDRAPACARGKTKGASRNNREAPLRVRWPRRQSQSATAIAAMYRHWRRYYRNYRHWFLRHCHRWRRYRRR